MASITKRDKFVATAVQHPPVFLDVTASVARACTLIGEAAAAGAQLVVFPETWLPGYPVWLDEAAGAALWGYEPAAAVFKRLFLNSVVVGDGATRDLCQAAKRGKVVVVMGMHERDGSTLYNSMLTIDAEGEIINLHRKLMPTYGERLIWGVGDGSTMKVVDTPLGRLGGLVCWEHWMALARQAMHAQQEVIHVAQWPTVKEMHLVASRHYAFEGQCFVVAAGTVLQKRDLSHLALPLLESIAGEPERFLMRGGSSIIAPDGTCLAGPLYERAELVSAEIEVGLVINGRLPLDVVGHYSRPDIFQLQVNTQRQSGVIFRDKS